MSIKHRVTESHAHPKFDRLTVDLRTKSKYFQARTFHDGRLHQKSTKTTALSTALRLAAEWYLKLIKADRPVHPRVEKDSTVAEMFASYRKHLEGSSKAYADMKWRPIREFWGTREIAETTSETFREFYAWRRRQKVVNHTIHKDVVLIRQVLRHAEERNVIRQLPTIPKIGKILTNPRPWFTKKEFLHLANVSRERINSATSDRLRIQRADCHDFMMFMYHSLMRVGELRALRFTDCQLDQNKSGQDILLCSVKGKSGARQVICRTQATDIWINRMEKHSERGGVSLSDPIFPHKTRDAFRELLKAAGLEKDEFGNPRNLKSLRATAIAASILAGVDQLLVARNAGTSLLMIDTFYVKRLSAQMGKDALTTFNPDENPEMFVKFLVESVPIPATNRRPRKGASIPKKNLPADTAAEVARELPTLDPETMRAFRMARQSASSPTSKEISEFLANRATNDK